MDNKIELTVVVNGTDVKVELNSDTPLRDLVIMALNKSGNTGQPVENWILKDIKGNPIDVSKTAADLHFNEHTVLFLSLKAGIGGSF